MYNFNLVNDYNRKLVIAGNVIDCYDYEFKVLKGKASRKYGRANEKNTTEETKRENRKKCSLRSKNKFIQLVNANFYKTKTKFCTLTYAENMQDLRKGLKDFKEFIQRLNYYLGYKVEYVAVIEFQERGAIHFHLLMNTEYIENSKLSDIWQQGFVKITKIDNVDNLGAYLSKYMTKDIDDERLIGKKRYLCSKHLKQPQTICNPKTVENILSDLPDVLRQKTFTYKTEYFGSITHTQIILKEQYPLKDFYSYIRLSYLDEIDLDFTRLPLITSLGSC